MSFARQAFRIALAVFFIVAGANHFVHPAFYVRIVPDWLPAPRLLVAISGACEILGGMGIFFPVTRRVAGISLIALLIAVFPANLQMAQFPQRYADIGTPLLFYARLPLQAVLLLWVWWTCF
ncbi:MAG: DoxX family membrane protein [Candidatus Eremiobacteraeota bacterium]|nr:DoxX family membrane protein [Candidatus Eremiobacteraeota bacterium]